MTPAQSVDNLIHVVFVNYSVFCKIYYTYTHTYIYVCVYVYIYIERKEKNSTHA